MRVPNAARLHERGGHAIALDIESVGESMGRHVDRELARTRVGGAQDAGQSRRPNSRRLRAL